MKFAVITPTRNRLYTLHLLHKYVSHQTRKPDLWIIATDGKEPHFSETPTETIISKADYAGTPIKSFTGNLMRAINIADEKGADAVLMMEDDDWYASNYIKEMEKVLLGADFIANKPIRWFNVPDGKMKLIDVEHCALAQLGFTRRLFDIFRSAIEFCAKAESYEVDKTFFFKVKEAGYTQKILQNPDIFLGLKGIYSVGYQHGDGLTRHPRRYRRTLKGYWIRLLSLNNAVRTRRAMPKYENLRQEIGEEDAKAYLEIVKGAEPTEFGEF